MILRSPHPLRRLNSPQDAVGFDTAESRSILLSDFGDSEQENHAATRAFPLIAGVHKSACPLGAWHPVTASCT